jgi:phage anti-repressor protein
MMHIKTSPKGTPYIPSFREFYQNIGLRLDNYSRWCKSNIENDAYFKENEHWYSLVTKKSEQRARGWNNKSKDYALTLEFAKHLCLMAKTPQAYEYRTQLLGLENQKENKELITAKEAAFVHMAINAFKSVINRKKALSDHMKAKLKDGNYGTFHAYRDSLLGYSKADIEREFKSIGVKIKAKNKTAERMLYFIDQDEIFRASLIDFMIGNGSGKENALAYGLAAKNICKHLPKIEKEISWDKTNTLFFNQEQHKMIGI